MEPRHLTNETVVGLRFVDVFNTTLHIGAATDEAITMGECYLSNNLDGGEISTLPV